MLFLVCFSCYSVYSPSQLHTKKLYASTFVFILSGLVVYMLLGRGNIIYNDAYVSSDQTYKLTEILNKPELLRKSLEKELTINPKDEKKQALLASVCTHLKDHVCASNQYIWLLKKYPKDIYFINYLKSRMVITKNLLNSEDRKLISVYLAHNFQSISVHRIAAQIAMAHKEYSKAAQHWRYVLDHIPKNDPDRKLLQRSYNVALNK
jgi:hypothetical protein